MKWSEFLNEIKDHTHLALVGPLLARAVPVVMPTIFVDGGSDFRADGLRLSSGSFPVVSVGDGDSAFGVLDEVLAARKNFSDLAFALRALPASVSSLEMFGFLGGRRDHELANFGEVHNFLATRSGGGLVNFHEEGEIQAIGFRGGFEMSIDGLFSVMTFAPTDVRISGDCEYKFEGRLEAASSLGLSNLGNGGLVVVESASPVFIFLT